jgi:glycosyltransferase involved in cell wall biosynthesis
LPAKTGKNRQKKIGQYCLAPARGRAIYRRLTELGQMAITHEAPADGTTAGAGNNRQFQSLSVIAPVYNEQGNIAPLCSALTAVLDTVGLRYEIILVNDGSKDKSLEEMRAAVAEFPQVTAIDLLRNYGQTAALMAGIDHASGEVIIPIDADLQNDPADIPAMIAKLREGYDVVSGWRKERRDMAIRRNLVSRIANRLISLISGVHLHDYGCTLKAYRRDVIKGVRLYGEMHRFIPIYATWMGAKVCEMPVRHHARRAGQSKYGLERVFKVVLDLIVVKFLDRYFTKPIYVFGGFGIMALAFSGLFVALMLYWKLAEGISMIRTPMPVLAGMTFLVGVISILMGLLAEILVRIYFETQQRPAYSVRSIINNSSGD